LRESAPSESSDLSLNLSLKTSFASKEEFE
jgi:hypothetical protein